MSMSVLTKMEVQVCVCVCVCVCVHYVHYPTKVQLIKCPTDTTAPAAFGAPGGLGPQGSYRGGWSFNVNYRSVKTYTVVTVRVCATCWYHTIHWLLLKPAVCFCNTMMSLSVIRHGAELGDDCVNGLVAVGVGGGLLEEYWGWFSFLSLLR